MDKKLHQNIDAYVEAQENCTMSEGISNADAQYAVDIVKEICAKVGPGSPGTPQERARAGMIKKELETHLGEENVVMEEFTLAPDGFLGSFPVSAVFLLCAALLNIFTGWILGRAAPGLPWVTNIISLAFSILPLLILVLEYIQYREFIDPFLKKKQSVNVIGALRRPGTKEVKRLLLIGGHHDSALENTWIALLGYGFFILMPVIFIGLLTMLVMSVIQLAGLITGSGNLLRSGTLSWGLLAFPILPTIIFTLFFNRGRKNGGTVPGATDNLAASAVGVAMCRFLVKHPETIPADTEIRFVSFGCEEAGLRGSRRYAARQLEELKRLDARLLNYEIIAYPEISILTNDVVGVKNDPEMVKSVVAAAERAGVPYKVTPYPTGGGGSDAGSFSQAGLKALTLFPTRFPQQIVAFFHQKRDTPDVLTIDPLMNVMKLTLEWIRCGGE